MLLSFFFFFSFVFPSCALRGDYKSLVDFLCEARKKRCLVLLRPAFDSSPCSPPGIEPGMEEQIEGGIEGPSPAVELVRAETRAHSGA